MIEARERRRLIALHDKTGNINFLRAAKCLDRGSAFADKANILLVTGLKKRGNPKIDDYDDCVRMAILMESNGLSQWAAALKMASESPGHSEKATAKRLDRKFKEKSDQYFWFARQFIRVQERRARS